MIDFIPLQHYFDFFIYWGMALLFLVYLHTSILNGNESKVFVLNTTLGWILVTTLILFIGLRPLSEYRFVDMATYAHIFKLYQHGTPLDTEGDIAFNLLTLFCSKIMSMHAYFLVCATLYILPLFLASKKWFPNYYFFVFLMLVYSFSFYAYGVNGMRNGIATSFFIYGLANHGNLKAMVFWLALSTLFHKSMMLPLVLFMATFYIKNTKTYYMAWFGSIILSVTMGGFWIQLFTQLGFGGDRMSGYLNNSPVAGKFSSTGFRWDFLIYSAIPIVAAYMYIYKFQFKDLFYNRLLGTYLLANAFWVMVIKANFSNRFAYLSWFLMAIIIFYPLFKKPFLKNQFKKVGFIMLGYFFITYTLTVILK